MNTFVTQWTDQPGIDMWYDAWFVVTVPDGVDKNHVKTWFCNAQNEGWCPTPLNEDAETAVQMLRWNMPVGWDIELASLFESRKY